jgi:predicted homoserine dehydrogenase-like protein
MNLHRLLLERAAAGKPVHVGLIGAGKFGAMFLSQVQMMPGVEVAVIADLDPERARSACHKAGWDATRIARTRFLVSGAEACADPQVEVIVEATGNPPAGIAHARAAINARKHIVMVNVEADVLARPPLAEEARRKGIVYSLAYGDQPALTCELVDWARPAASRSWRLGRGRNTCPPITP